MYHYAFKWGGVGWGLKCNGYNTDVKNRVLDLYLRAVTLPRVPPEAAKTAVFNVTNYILWGSEVKNNVTAPPVTRRDPPPSYNIKGVGIIHDYHAKQKRNHYKLLYYGGTV